jgi:hypothetical protein
MRNAAILYQLQKKEHEFGKNGTANLFGTCLKFIARPVKARHRKFSIKIPYANHPTTDNIRGITRET